MVWGGLGEARSSPPAQLCCSMLGLKHQRVGEAGLEAQWKTSCVSAKPLVGGNPGYPEGPPEHLQKAVSTAVKWMPFLLGAVS